MSMNSTDKSKSTANQLAGELFDNAIVPLAERRGRAAVREYFPLAGEPGATTYFNEPTLSSMQPADFDFPGDGTADGMLDALHELWTEQGESGLAALVPQLKQIAAALRNEPAEANGDVSIFCYTMY
jgi:hypothetical protein